MTRKLLLDVNEDGIAVLTLNRPDTHNALDLEMMRQFAHSIESLAARSDVRVLVVTGAGQAAFSSGGDLAELSHHATPEAGAAMIQMMGDALLQMERLPYPVVAAINGYALGGGGEIALACDMRIVDEKARLGMLHIRLGLTPGWGAGQRLLRLVGYARAMEILLRGRTMHAHELQALGLVNDVVPAGTALTRALNFARQIAEAPPDVVRGVKAVLQAGLTQPYTEALQTERAVFPTLWGAAAHITAVANFLKKQRH
jgi:enoyl-CoA hydratase/carnithine racemase